MALSAGDVTAGCRLFAAGEYARPHQALPVLLAGAHHSAATGPVGAARL